MCCQTQETSLHAPLQGAATCELNGMIPEPLPIYSESFMTTAVTICHTVA